MPRSIRIGVVGDWDPKNSTHIGTNEAFRHAENQLGATVEVDWLPTASIIDMVRGDRGPYAGLLVAPGSPYRNMQGALNAVRWARENDVPLLGTCGGFQHMVIEFARNALGIIDAEHAEEHPHAAHLYVTPLACSLVGQTEPVTITPGSHAFRAYGKGESVERFYCSFGLNPAHRSEIEQGGLRTSGVDRNGEVRIMEHARNRFCFGTLFVPQMSSTPESPHPLILGLVSAASE